jgi:hypothetical protein
MSNLEDGLLLDLIDHVYGAAIDPSRWADVIAALGIAFRAQFSLMLIAAKLAEGYSLNEIAQMLSISIETVRTHTHELLGPTQLAGLYA